MAIKSGETVWKKLYAYPEFFAVGPTQPPFMPPTVVVASTQPGLPYLTRPVVSPMAPSAPGSLSGGSQGGAQHRPGSLPTVVTPSIEQMATLYAGSHNASAGDRMVAAFIDGLVWMLSLLPLWFCAMLHLSGAEISKEFLKLSIIFASITFGLAFIIQGWLLATRGQSIGKSIMHVRVVLLSSGDEPPGLVAGVLVRWLAMRLLYVVPIVPIADFIFLFREERRCLHDYVAGTRVIVIDD
ncbi:MAG: RDD family protein [Opitutaceae bacterium]|nr:RDD family protein [Opitutaceae bacterium]